MEIIALIVSIASFIVSGLGTYLANKRASEALNESRKSAEAAQWSAIQESVQRLIGFDPSAEPVGDRLANLRIAMINLVDHIEDWPGLDEWLESERVLGALLGRQVIEAAKPSDSIEERLTNLDPIIKWAQALSSNLRRFRSYGYDGEALTQLRTHANESVKSISQRNGWDLPDN